MDNYIEIEFSDGTKARWAVDDGTADQVAADIEGIAGPPMTLLT